MSAGPEKAPAERAVKDIRRQTRRQYSAEEKIRIVLEGLRESGHRAVYGFMNVAFNDVNGLTS